MRSALSRLAAARLGAAEAEAPCRRWAAAATTTSLSIAHHRSPSSSTSFSSFSTSTSSSSSSTSFSSLSTSTSSSSSSSPASRPVPPSKFMHDVFARARASPQRILLNEPGDPRVLAAAAALAERGLCVPVLLGSRPGIEAFAGELAGTLLQREKEASNNGRNNSNGKSGRKKSGSSDSEEGDVEALPADRRFLRGLERCEIIDPLRAEEVGELTARYADELARARAHKGMTLAAARELLRPEEHGRRVPSASIHFATMMLRSGDAGGLLSGAAHTTLETVRPALQLLTRRPHGERGGEEEDGGGGGARTGKSGAGGAAGAGEAAVSEAAPPGLVSSLFFMCLPRGVVAFADCALNVSPTPAELARIALDSASTARAFGLSPPRVALLSYSTRGSGRGAGPAAAAAAAEAARRAAPEGVFVDGPLQYDAAVSPSVAALKLGGGSSSSADDGHTSPSFDVAGRANVLVFPDLSAGNIAYKAVQQATGAAAVGPVLQGLCAPVNDLSRGASVDDIVCTAAVTAVQAIAAAEEREKGSGGRGREAAARA